MTNSTADMTPMEHFVRVGSERVNAPISTAELERRWRAVRAAMEDRAVDALFVHSHVDGLGGATRWFADLQASGGYPCSLVFFRSEPMTTIMHGPLDGDRPVARDDPVLRGVGRALTTASFVSATFTQYFDSDLAVEVLEAHRPKRVGIVYPAQIPYTMLDGIKRGLPGVEFVDFSEAIDEIKVIKSPEEQAAIQATATLQDEALAYGFSVAEPGMRDCDITAAMLKFCCERGSEGGKYMVGSAPVGQPAMFQLLHNQQRVIKPGDAITINLENSGPGGYFTHVGRNAVLGKASQQMRDEFEVALGGQRLCVEMFRPGVKASEIFTAYDEYLRSNGLPGEKRLFCHGQGYDLVERPLIRDDESMTIKAGMNIGCHPMWVRQGTVAFLNDNFLVGEDETRRLHAFAQEVVELG